MASARTRLGESEVSAGEKLEDPLEKLREAISEIVDHIGVDPRGNSGNPMMM